jgi:hypothetical protein
LVDSSKDSFAMKGEERRERAFVSEVGVEMEEVARGVGSRLVATLC